MVAVEPQYEVTRLQSNDLYSLRSFYQTYFPEKNVLNNEELWLWSFTQNPLIGGKFPFFVIKAKGKIVGTIGFLSVNFQIGSKVFSGAHPVNFFVAPKYKGLPALRLFRSVLKERDVIYASYLSEDAVKLLKASGFIDLSDYLSEYHYSLGYLPENSEATSWLLKTKTLVINSARAIWLQVLNQLCVFSSITHQINHTWKPDLMPSIETQDRIGVIKDQSYMHWRYSQSPTLQCTYITVHKNNHPIGLSIVHRDGNKAVILEIIVNLNNPFNLICLICHTISFCKKENHQLLTTVALNKRIEKALSLIGFGKMRSSHGLMAFSKEKYIKAAFQDRNKWDFIVGNTDIY